MNLLGLEIRRSPVKSLNALYADVDLILNQYQIPKRGINEDLAAEAIATRLQKLLKNDRYFCICTYDDLSKLGELHVDCQRRKFYSALHCVDYSEMLPEFKMKLFAMILDDFREILNPISE